MGNALIPIGPILLIAVWAARLCRGKPTTPAPPPGPGTRWVNRPIPAWLWAQLLYPFFAVVALATVPRLALWAVPTAFLYFPWMTARGAARAGWIGGARRLAALALFVCRKDRKGGPWLAAALGLCARRRHRERDAQRIIAALDALPAPVRGAALAARGLVAASRGQVEEARDLLRSIEHLDPRITPAVARKAARDWLAADAAARGDWQEAARLGCAPGPRSRAVRSLGLAARRLAGAPDAPGDLRLRLAWLSWPSGRRRITSGGVRPGSPSSRPLHPRQPPPAPRRDLRSWREHPSARPRWRPNRVA